MPNFGSPIDFTLRQWYNKKCIYMENFYALCFPDYHES